MKIDLDKLRVENNEADARFEAVVGGHLALVQYRCRGNTIIFIHTEVPEALSGHGIANKLAKTALDYARAQHLRVVAYCPFVKGYIERHPEYQDLLLTSKSPNR